MMEKSLLDGKNVLVTGGSGVIGRELLKLLSAAGANVLTVDRVVLEDADALGVRHVTKDLAVDNLDELREFSPSTIFHLAAAFERSQESPDFWATNWHDNMLVSHRIADVARDLPGLDSFIFASSYLIYSTKMYLSTSLQEVRLLRESDQVEPRNLTGAAKFYAERELEFIKEFKPSLRLVNARIYRVYGRGSKDVVSRWVRAALAGEDIQIYNGKNRFDFIFARDVAEGLLRLAENPAAAGTVNLGSGVARSIEDVVKVLEGLADHPLQTRDLGVTEPFEASCADISRLRELTGWIPATGLEQGITELLRFERQKAGDIVA